MLEDLDKTLSEHEERLQRLERRVIYNDKKWKFSNGNVIFRNGKPVDPESDEGKKIEEILDRQRKERPNTFKKPEE